MVCRPLKGLGVPGREPSTELCFGVYLKTEADCPPGQRGRGRARLLASESGGVARAAAGAGAGR